MTTLDRLARAAWGKTPKCDLQGVSKGPCSLDDECDCWRVAKANIRAILLELREPGEAADAGATVEHRCVTFSGLNTYEDWQQIGKEDATKVWQAMIDAILEGKA